MTIYEPPSELEYAAAVVQHNVQLAEQTTRACMSVMRETASQMMETVVRTREVIRHTRKLMADIDAGHYGQGTW